VVKAIDQKVCQRGVDVGAMDELEQIILSDSGLPCFIDCDV
jgi:hypothetical protein